MKTKKNLPHVVFCTVSSAQISADIDAHGSIISTRNIRAHCKSAVTGCTRIEGFTGTGDTAARIIEGGCSFTRTLSDRKGRTCTVVDTFLSAENSIRWDIEINGTGSLWSAPMITDIHYDANKSSRFWTAWSDPEHRSRGWRDPRVLRAFRNEHWDYSNVSHFTPERGDFISLPLVTIAEPSSDTGISFCLSPEDRILTMHLQTRKNGNIRFKRENHRLGENNTVRFSIDIAAHEADWRGGLRFYTQRYPAYFNPPMPASDAMAGCGAYSGFEGPIDAERLKKMSFRTNWKLSDDFAWMGMFIPPVKDADEKWERACMEPTPDGKPSTTSCRQMNDYAAYMKNNGFYVLNYFNVTELGKKMNGPAGTEPASNELWKSPIHFQKKMLPNAVLDARLKTFYGARVTDCGDDQYHDFILEQADRHIAMLPDTFGICIDRMDWMRHYNSSADDGVSLINGKPARSLAESWKKLLHDLGPKMHNAGKVLFANPMTMRIDLMNHVDGFFSEHGEAGPGLNSIAFIGMRKAAMTWSCMWWVRPVYKLKPNPDLFFQRHLIMGVYPIAPYPFNNHALRPHPITDKHYLDYGPLMDAMRGKKWVLAPHCAESATSGVLVNLYEADGGYSVPVAFGGKKEYAEVLIRNIPGLESMKATVLHPGADAAVSVSAVFENDTLTLEVPLIRGCGMVRLVKNR